MMLKDPTYKARYELKLEVHNPGADVDATVELIREMLRTSAVSDQLTNGPDETAARLAALMANNPNLAGDKSLRALISDPRRLPAKISGDICQCDHIL